MKKHYLLYISRNPKRSASRKLWINNSLENGYLSFQNFSPNIGVLKLRSGWYRMEYVEICIFCTGYRGMYGRYQTFMPFVTTRVQSLQWFLVVMDSWLVYFLMNHGNSMEVIMILIKLSCSPWRVYKMKLELKRCE